LGKAQRLGASCGSIFEKVKVKGQKIIEIRTTKMHPKEAGAL